MAAAKRPGGPYSAALRKAAQLAHALLSDTSALDQPELGDDQGSIRRATASPIARLAGSTLRQIIEHAAQDVLIVKPDSLGLHFSTRVRGAHILFTAMPPIGYTLVA